MERRCLFWNGPSSPAQLEFHEISIFRVTGHSHNKGTLGSQPKTCDIVDSKKVGSNTFHNLGLWCMLWLNVNLYSTYFRLQDAFSENCMFIVDMYLVHSILTYFTFATIYRMLVTKMTWSLIPIDNLADSKKVDSNTVDNLDRMVEYQIEYNLFLPMRHLRKKRSLRRQCVYGKTTWLQSVQSRLVSTYVAGDNGSLS